MRAKLGEVKLKAGDTLLFIADPGSAGTLSRSCSSRSPGSSRLVGSSNALGPRGVLLVMTLVTVATAQFLPIAWPFG